MYGLTFDLDTHILEDVYKISRSKAYSLITKDLEAIGFKHLQYSFYVKWSGTKFLDKNLVPDHAHTLIISV